MWRKTLARTHPEAGGDHDLFVWIRVVRDAMCNGGGTTAERYPPPRREPRSEPPPKSEPRLIYKDGHAPFPEVADFEALTLRALATADEVQPLYADLLRMLKDCELVDYEPLHDQQQRGATYKQLAAIGHNLGMDQAQRVRWYRIAEGVPLSIRHAGHILSRLKGRTA
jgi:hypothetical protein